MTDFMTGFIFLFFLGGPQDLTYCLFRTIKLLYKYSSLFTLRKQDKTF